MGYAVNFISPESLRMNLPWSLHMDFWNEIQLFSWQSYSIDQDVKNRVIRPKYEYKLLRIDFFGRIQIWMYLLENTNMNLIESHFPDKYQFRYICVTKNGQIQIQIWIFELIFKNTNTNTNIYHALNKINVYLCKSL